MKLPNIAFILIFVFFNLAKSEGQIICETFSYYSDEKDTLKADLYFNDSIKSSLETLVVFVHGGGFRRGIRNFKDDVDYCKNLAERGYVAMSIDYRLYFKDKPGITRSSRNKSYSNAVKLAVNDLYASIDFLSKNSQIPKLDFDNVFVSGGSAGATTAIASIYPYFSYIKDSLNAIFSISGIISAAGSSIDLMETQKSNKPIMLIHGACDSSVSMDCEEHYSNEDDLILKKCGSIPIYYSRIESSRPTKLIVECQSGHEVAWESFNKHISEIDRFIKLTMKGTKFFEVVYFDKSKNACATPLECIGN